MDSATWINAEAVRLGQQTARSAIYWRQRLPLIVDHPKRDDLVDLAARSEVDLLLLVTVLQEVEAKRVAFEASKRRFLTALELKLPEDRAQCAAIIRGLFA